MLTEQEVIAVLNEKLSKNEVKPETMRFINKLQSLEKMIQEQATNMKSLTDQVAALQDEVKRTRGAKSMLLELIAEEEGLISDQPEEPKEQS